MTRISTGPFAARTRGRVGREFGIQQCILASSNNRSTPGVLMTFAMRISIPYSGAAATVCLLSLVSTLHAQGTLADYQRAHDLRSKARDLVVNTPGAATWIGDTDHFWYPKTVKGGTAFILVDAEAGSKKPAFDQDKLAAAISTATGHPYTGLKLPFAPMQGRPGARPTLDAIATTAPLTFLDGERSIQFGVDGSLYKCSLSDYTCTKGGPIQRGGREGRGAAPADLSLPNAEATFEGLGLEGLGGDPVDGLEYQPPASQDGDQGRYQGRPRGCAPSQSSNPSQPSQPSPPRAARVGAGGQSPPAPAEVCTSFDGNYEAFVQNFNVFLKPKGDQPAYPISFDGSEDNYYSLRTFAWSPDSKKLVAYHTRPGYDREVMQIESSPNDQIQPKHSTFNYPKPGDTLDIAFPVLFDIATKHETEIDRALFPNPFSISTPVWWKDNRGFTFEYNQRGHQAYSVIEVDPQTGKTRPLIAEQTKTFFYYSDLGPGLSAGRKYRHDVNDGKEIIWASERDGWEHLYLYNGVSGKVKNQITKGNWLVRNVEYVDDAKRQIWFDRS